MTAWTVNDLKKQYARAKQLGWLDHFIGAASRLDLEPSTLLAIASRESNLDPVYLTKAGDNGNGYGIMQVDRRSHAAHVKSGAWRDARANIEYGASVLRQMRDVIRARAGRLLSIRTPSGRLYTAQIPAVIPPDDLERIAIAAYNSGLWALYHYAKRRDPDFGTTGKNYSADVLARARVFKELLDADGHSESVAVKDGVLMSDDVAVEEEMLATALADERVQRVLLKALLRVASLITVAWGAGAPERVLIILSVIGALYVLYKINAHRTAVRVLYKFLRIER